MDFQQADKEFKQLKRRYTAGEITEAEFKARLEDLMVQDERGNWWMLGFESERWYRYDGRAWAEDTPPANAALEPVGQTPRPTEPVLPQPAAPRSPRRWRMPVGIAGGLCLLALAFYMIPKWIRGAPATPSAIPGYYETQSAAFATEPPATEAPAAAATEAPTVASAGSRMAVYSDDFSNPSSGWLAYSDSNRSVGYSGGQFVIRNFKPYQDTWSHPGLDLGDVDISVDAAKVSGPDDNDYGIICRYQNDENFYFFLVSGEGGMLIGKFLNNEFIGLSASDMQPSDSVGKGTAVNQLTARCIGSTLTFYVNGGQVASVEDTSFSRGDVGLMAGTNSKPGVVTAFDNFGVWGP